MPVPSFISDLFVDRVAVAGLNSAFVFCGVVGVIGGAVALLAFGRQDPLKTVWDNRDERTSVGSVEVPA